MDIFVGSLPFKIKSDQIYLDHLNQLYVIQSQDHLILKFDDQFQIKKQFPFITYYLKIY